MLQELAEKQPVKDYLPVMCHIQKERGLFSKKLYKSEENNKKNGKKKMPVGTEQESGYQLRGRAGRRHVLSLVGTHNETLLNYFGSTELSCNFL